MGSSRLPGKVLADIAGKTMLQRVIERVAAAQGVDEVVVATTDAREDDILVEHLENEATCQVYRGSVHDVLDRCFGCATVHRAQIVVRATADDPLKDPQIIDRAIRLLTADPNLDYCSNTIEPSYPEGLDIEVLRFAALERAHREAQLTSEREHVTPYVWRHPELFNLFNFKSDRDLSDWRWTVDKREDLELVRRIFEHFKAVPLVPYQDVISWLDLNPEVRSINSGTVRTKGYRQSLQLEDQ